MIGGQPRLLVLGSFPGEASLAQRRYYAHPRNQFWPIVGELLGEPLADLDYARRLDRLIAHGVALWDVLGACRRDGSLDAAIRTPRPNDLDGLLCARPSLGAVAFNGTAASRAEAAIAARGLATYRLPSTSPAHAGLAPAAKLQRWRVLVDDGWIRPADGRAPGR